MNRILKIAMLCLAVVLMASPGHGPGERRASSARLSWAVRFGAGLVILGAGFGIGKIGASAVESMARQPEVAGSVQTAMIIAAALIEGATFFALIICMLFNN